VSDMGSMNGILVNGALANRHRLSPGDRIEFPDCGGVRLIFDPGALGGGSLFLSHIHQLEDAASSEFERVRLLLDFSHEIRGADIYEEVLHSLIEMAMRLTGSTSALLWTRPDGSWQPACAGGKDPGAAVVTTAHLEECARTRAGFVRWSLEPGLALYALPVRETRLQALSSSVTALPAKVTNILTLVGPAAPATPPTAELLYRLAGEAAQLLDRAQQVRRQQEARVYEREMALAAEIQQALMASPMPRVPFATVAGFSRACQQIGGDFYDAVAGHDEIAWVLADISGKGAAAALLAGSLQGLVHSQLLDRRPLTAIASTVNQYLLQRLRGEKYATMVLARLAPNGQLELVNCGHPPPLLAGSDGAVSELTSCNLPVGLIAEAEYQAQHLRLTAGDRLLLSSDGVTEAANAAGDMFGDQRLQALARTGASLDDIARALLAFTTGNHLADDCTLLSIAYR
ncbi:MAG TPA: SpoIIE family protein phosphatase, partial [Terriglobales bacterium]